MVGTGSTARATVEIPAQTLVVPTTVYIVGAVAETTTDAPVMLFGVHE
jgi:hypothetical protein